MDYDFFESEEQENRTERIPAPSPQGKYAPVKEKKIRWWHLLLAAVFALFTFFAGYLVCWNTLDGELRTLINVKEQIQKHYYEEVTDEEFYAAVFGGINEDLLDEYSQYMTAEEFAQIVSELAGNRSGLGMVFTTGTESPLRISRVCGNSPAEAAGILAGETVVGCGDSVGNIAACTTYEELKTFLSNYAENEEFYLKIRSLGGEEWNVKISKKAYVESLVFYRTKETSCTFTGENRAEIKELASPLTCLDEETAYIRLIEFTGNAARDFAAAMQKFQTDGKKNLVLDLRGNGGGYLDVMRSIASYFCKTATEKTPVVAVGDFGERKENYTADGNYYAEYFSSDSRICVLADSYSASAAECLLGAMLDYGAITYADICLAERQGVAKTYGKGIMQETYILSVFEQNALKLTTAQIRWPKSNTCIHGRGILPSDGTLTVEENFDYDVETQAAVAALFAK